MPAEGGNALPPSPHIQLAKEGERRMWGAMPQGAWANARETGDNTEGREGMPGGGGGSMPCSGCVPQHPVIHRNDIAAHDTPGRQTDRQSSRQRRPGRPTHRQSDRNGQNSAQPCRLFDLARAGPGQARVACQIMPSHHMLVGTHNVRTRTLPRPEERGIPTTPRALRH
jgi:hypothetical protein